MWSIDRRGAAASLAVVLAAALAGCAATPKPAHDAVAAAPTPLDQYKPIVERTPQSVALSVHATGLSPRQHEALATFAARWRDGGGAQTITVDAPANTRLQGDAQVTVVNVARELGALGVPPARLRFGGYDAGGAPGAPVIARYELYVAHGVDCASRWDNLVATNSNRPSRHFGCTQAANLAVEVADAHDLVAPAASAPADSMRRAIVLEKYRHGEIFSSAKDPQAAGAVSTVIQ